MYSARKSKVKQWVYLVTYLMNTVHQNNVQMGTVHYLGNDNYLQCYKECKDRVVASDTRGPRFKSSHWQKFIYIEHLF